MEDLQATVEIAVDLGRLCNVDLFQRGFYQIAVKLLEPVHPQAKVEVHIIKRNDSDHFCPARVLDDGLGAVSKCLQVLYKREECQLNHTFLFRVHCLLDSQKIMECLKKFNFQLEIGLRFSNSDDMPEGWSESMEEVSKRALRLELDLIYGLFANTMVLFDYGYMAAVEVTIHASLVALHQPFMTMPGVTPSTRSPNSEPATLESILFRPLPGMSVGQADNFDVRMSNAISVHAKLVKILLTVYANMQNYYIALLRSLPGKYQEIDEATDVTKSLSDMTSHLQRLNTLEEIVSQVNMNLASTCSLILGLWSHVLDSSCQNKQVRKQLAMIYHKCRVNRFQSAFFTTENPRNAQFDDARCGIYNWTATEIRSSRYFSELPVLPIHNDEADGTTDNIPVIFEDIYTHQCKKEPSFRPRSSLGIFSRSSMPTTSHTHSVEQSNGILDVSEELGREELGVRSPDGSISSCGEASEAMVFGASKEESSHSKKKKYSGIFRKRRGSYKLRSQRLSMSDDESTKVTLAEFLSSIDDTMSSQPPKSKSSSNSSNNSVKSKPSSAPKHTKLKASNSANDTAQRILQRFGVGKRNSDVTDTTAADDKKALPRSFSSSALNMTKAVNGSRSSQSSFETAEDNLVRRASDDASFKIASVNGTRPLLRGFTTTASRRAENRFRALLRSETSEEPESGISEKPVALSAMKPFISPISVKTSSSVPPVTTTPSVPTMSSSVTESSGSLKKVSNLHNGMVKSQSYSMGIERLQNGTDGDNQYPRPHANYMNTVPCGPHGRLKTSHTTLGGLDRVRYGMGLHPGGGTVTTTDLSPFDEPDQPQTWGQLSSSTTFKNNLQSTPLNSSAEDDSISATENADVVTKSHDDTLVDKEETLTSTDMETEVTNVTNGLDDKCSFLEFLKEDQMEEPGSFFFESSEEIASVQGSTLPDNPIFLHPQRSQSLLVFTGSLNCSEEPSDAEFVKELESLGEKEKTMRDAVFEPEPKFGYEPEKKIISNANSSNASGSSAVNGSNTNSKNLKFNPKMSTRTKLPQLIGDINLNDVEAALLTTVDIFNAIPPLRQQRERNHMLEKSKLLGRLHFPGLLFTDIPPPIPFSPYLTQRLSISRGFASESEDHHLVVCVHGLDGNANDLRLVRTYLQLGVPPSTNLSFLMSRANQDDTYADIDTMTERLATEITDYIDFNYTSGKQPSRISFIGHSLGCLLIRSTIAHERMAHLKSRFYTFLSFSGPHLGTIFNNSALVSTGLWLIQKWKKSACLLQLACKDHADLRKTYIYKLSKRRGLEFFQNIVLIASAADRYVPYHSARIEMCKQAFRDKTMGPPYQEMLNNIMKPVLSKSKLNLVRYHVVHPLSGTSANTVIGRAAHIAVLDSEVFLEKFFLVAGLRFFV